MIFKNICILVLWTKVASALEGLKPIPGFLKKCDGKKRGEGTGEGTSLFALPQSPEHLKHEPQETTHICLSISKVNTHNLKMLRVGGGGGYNQFQDF